MTPDLHKALEAARRLLEWPTSYEDATLRPTRHRFADDISTVARAFIDIHAERGADKWRPIEEAEWPSWLKDGCAAIDTLTDKKDAT